MSFSRTSNQQTTMETTTTPIVYTVYVYYREHKYDRRYSIKSECLDTACDAGVKAFIKGVLSSGDRGAFITRRIADQRPQPWLQADRAEDGSVSFRQVRQQEVAAI